MARSMSATSIRVQCEYVAICSVHARVRATNSLLRLADRMNARPDLVSGVTGLNGSLWVQTPAGRQAEILSLKASREHGRRETIVITGHMASDAYGLLILAPEIALGSGWLGGDRVAGRGAIRDLLIKAARFNEDERQRLTIHLPSKAITLRLDEIERHFGA